MHFPTVDFHLLQGLVYLLHLHLAAREDYHSFQVASLENVLYDLQLLRLIANICTLLYLLGWLAHSKLYLNRILQQALCKLLYVFWHSGREHYCLAIVRKL